MPSTRQEARAGEPAVAVSAPREALRRHIICGDQIGVGEGGYQQEKLEVSTLLHLPPIAATYDRIRALTRP